MRRVLSIPTLLLLAGSIQILLAQEIINGQTALVTLPEVSASSKVMFGKQEIPLLQDPIDTNKHFVLLPIAYRSDTGTKTLKVTYPDGTNSMTIDVKKGGYPSETITVAPSKVKPDKAQAKRTAAEYEEAMAIYRKRTPRRYWSKPFIHPMASQITSHYGTARVYNGSLRSFHSGTDFKAEIGTPVYVVNDGVVVLAKERFYAGNSIVVDHGEGLYTCYYHLSSLSVTPGDKVKQGDFLGLSGATGRVTGPHLHFAVMLYGVQVDPLQLMSQINSLFTRSL